MNTTDKILGYEEFVALVIEALEAAGIEYMIGGAVATWAWGEPRATLDLDLVVNIPLDAIGDLSKELEKRDMLVPENIIMDNILETRSDLPISAIHIHSGYKADIYPLREGDEQRSKALQRRQKIDLGKPLGEVYLHSPEDLIIYKLWFFSISQQTKHSRDIASIVMTLYEELDYDYINSWMEKRGLGILWEEMLTRIRAKS
jgi:hypothetical protein